MSSVSDDKLSLLLEKWHETKKQIAELEAKCEKYKIIADKILDYKDTNILTDKYFILRRREIKRNTVSKKDLPADIWNRYSKETSYTSYYLTPRKSDKKDKKE